MTGIEIMPHVLLITLRQLIETCLLSGEPPGLSAPLLDRGSAINIFQEWEIVVMHPIDIV